MKKHLFALLSAGCLSFGLIAQEDKSNLIPCSTFEAMEEGFAKNPALKAQYEAQKTQFEIEYQKALTEFSNKRTAATVYTVPVVFHIMGQQNINDQVFIDALAQINKDYSKTGSDIATIDPTFAPLYVDAEIRFMMAKRDPLGNCTNGIIRHNNESIYWDQMNPNYKFSGTGTNRWPVNKYLNIYIVNCISNSMSGVTCPTTGGAFVGGYTYLPGGTPYTSNGNMGDAIVYRANLLGQLSPNDVRSLSHEIGHWFNLLHTFGNTNNPGSLSCGDPNLNDNVSDTPETQGDFSTCPSSIGTNPCDASSNKNVENIMNYSSCPKMFTQGQVTRMRTAIQSSIGGRNNLWTASNLTATGISTSYTCAPVADFKSNKTNVCVGSSVTFTTQSYVGSGAGTYTWTFQGGTPATSNATSQAVTYATPGTYSVSLTASNGSGSNTINRISYITVYNGAGGAAAPNVHDFETTGIPSDINVVNGNTGTVAWTQNTTTGASATTKCMFLNNASTSNTIGHIDYFETPFYNFSTTTGISLSYYYAYAKKNAAQVDTFKVQYSLDCGGTWANVLGIPTTAAMATASGGTTTAAFTPSATQWKQVSVSSALMAALNNKPSVKFRFYFRNDVALTSANNIYIDQINISGTVGLNELENEIELALYPNPTNNTSVIEFSSKATDKINITVLDMLGKTMEQCHNLDGSNGKISYTINQSGQLAQGIYLVNLEVNGKQVTKKLVIE